MKPAERLHLRTHQVRHSSTRRVVRNMKGGFCKVAAARIKYHHHNHRLRNIPRAAATTRTTTTGYTGTATTGTITTGTGTIGTATTGAATTGITSPTTAATTELTAASSLLQTVTAGRTLGLILWRVAAVLTSSAKRVPCIGRDQAVGSLLQQWRLWTFPARATLLLLAENPNNTMMGLTWCLLNTRE